MHRSRVMRIGDYVIESIDSQPGGCVLDAIHVLLPRRAKIVMVDRTFEIACVLERIKHPSVPRVYECGLDPQPWIAIPDVDEPLQVLAAALVQRGFTALAASLVEPIECEDSDYEDVILLEAEAAISLGGVS